MKMTAAKARRVAIAVATLIIFGLAIYALKMIVREVDLGDVVTQLGNVETRFIMLAVLFTVGSYFMLTLFDYFAVVAVGRRLPYFHTAMAATVAYGIGHTAGVPPLSGGSIRYRYYSPEGLSALEIAGVVTMVSLNFLLGFSALLGLSLVIGAEGAARTMPFGAGEAQLIGALLLVAIGGYLTLTYFRRTPLRVMKREFQFPSLRLSLGQLLVGCLDLCFSAAALYILMPADVGISFPAFVGVYVIAMQAGVLSNVPGGLGVFESVLLLLLPGVTNDAVLGAVVLYRLVYYVLPFIVALILMMLRESIYGDGQLRRAVDWIRGRA